jgi:hypothetical protein
MKLDMSDLDNDLTNEKCENSGQNLKESMSDALIGT